MYIYIYIVKKHFDFLPLKSGKRGTTRRRWNAVKRRTSLWQSGSARHVIRIQQAHFQRKQQGSNKDAGNCRALADVGFECLLAKEGGFMRDIGSGEMIPLTKRGNLYVLKACVTSADSDFVRPS